MGTMVGGRDVASADAALAGLVDIDGNGGAAGGRRGDGTQSGASRRAGSDHAAGSRATDGRAPANGRGQARRLGRHAARQDHRGQPHRRDGDRDAGLGQPYRPGAARRGAWRRRRADIFFGVPGVAVQSDAKRAASSVNIRGLQDFGRVAVIVDGARQDFQRSGHGTQSDVLDRSGTAPGGRRDPRAGRQHLWLRRHRRRRRLRDQGRGRISCGRARRGPPRRRAATTPTATAGRPARPAPTASTMRSTCSATSSGATTTTTRTATATTVGGTGFDVLSGLLKSHDPADRQQRIEARLGRHRRQLDRGRQTPTTSTSSQNTFTGRYNITDDEQSWLDLHINGSLNKTDLDQTYLTDVDAVQFARPGCRSSSRQARRPPTISTPTASTSGIRRASRPARSRMNSPMAATG